MSNAEKLDQKQLELDQMKLELDQKKIELDQENINLDQLWHTCCLTPLQKCFSPLAKKLHCVS